MGTVCFVRKNLNRKKGWFERNSFSNLVVGVYIYIYILSI